MAPIKTFVGKFAKAAFTVSAPSSTKQQQQQQQQQLPTTSASSPSSDGALSSFCLEKMCQLFKVEPVNNLYLSTTDGERGVCLNKPVKSGDAIMSIPISSCFRDDERPRSEEENNNSEWGDDDVGGGGDNEQDITDYERYNPSGWASRLAASLLDAELGLGMSTTVDDDLKLGREIWQSMLPDKDLLHASLPVHWGEEVLATSKCTALELAVDSAYFARATAVMDLSADLKEALVDCKEDDCLTDEEMLKQKCDDDAMDVALDMEMLQRKCHDALDIVQTRACRVERTCEDGVQWGPPLRILAPIFDFINHGSIRAKKGAKGSANASYGVENRSMCDMQNAKLVVRATRDMMEGEEVLIDYGDSARPTWRCLTSYGFVPEYDIDSEVVDEENAENVAELWMNGLRFEIDPHSVPFDLVEVAAAQALLDGEMEEEEEDEHLGGGMLTPFVARAIAKRATDAAFNLITEPEMVDSEEDWDSPELIHAACLAMQLRWSQHKVLLAFAENLNLLFSSPSPSPKAE
ncbi:hypothetical protein ACHAXR_008368 [Thalassiosira sp. AJA248-18]